MAAQDRKHNESTHQTASVDQPLLSSLANDADMAELIELFVSELSSRAADLHRMIEGRDLEGVRRLAHQLKGASAGYGFEILGTSAGRLETSAAEALHTKAEHDVSNVTRQANELIALCQRVRAA